MRFDPAETRRIERPVQVATPGVTVRGLAARLADGAAATLVEIGADGVALRDFRVDGLLVLGNLLGPVGDTGVRVEGCATARIAGHVVRGTDAGPGIAVAGGRQSP